MQAFKHEFDSLGFWISPLDSAMPFWWDSFKCLRLSLRFGGAIIAVLYTLFLNVVINKVDA